MEILNTWTSTTEKKKFYTVGNPIYKKGDFAIYKLNSLGYLYAFKNIAINNLVGLNTEHLDRLATKKRPEGKYNANHFLFDQSLKSLERGLKLI